MVNTQGGVLDGQFLAIHEKIAKPFLMLSVFFAVLLFSILSVVLTNNYAYADEEQQGFDPNAWEDVSEEEILQAEIPEDAGLNFVILPSDVPSTASAEGSKSTETQNPTDKNTAFGEDENHLYGASYVEPTISDVWTADPTVSLVVCARVDSAVYDGALFQYELFYSSFETAENHQFLRNSFALAKDECVTIKVVPARYRLWQRLPQEYRYKDARVRMTSRMDDTVPLTDVYYGPADVGPHLIYPGLAQIEDDGTVTQEAQPYETLKFEYINKYSPSQYWNSHAYALTNIKGADYFYFNVDYGLGYGPKSSTDSSKVHIANYLFPLRNSATPDNVIYNSGAFWNNGVFDDDSFRNRVPTNFRPTNSFYPYRANYKFGNNATDGSGNYGYIVERCGNEENKLIKANNGSIRDCAKPLKTINATAIWTREYEFHLKNDGCDSIPKYNGEDYFSSVNQVLIRTVHNPDEDREGNSLLLPRITCEGEDLKYWYDESNPNRYYKVADGDMTRSFTRLISDFGDSTNIPVATLRTGWNYYSLKFDANGGTGDISYCMKYGSTGGCGLTRVSPGIIASYWFFDLVNYPTRSGYELACWSERDDTDASECWFNDNENTSRLLTDSDGSYRIYKKEGSQAWGARDRTLYAVWRKIEYVSMVIDLDPASTTEHDDYNMVHGGHFGTDTSHTSHWNNMRLRKVDDNTQYNEVKIAAALGTQVGNVTAPSGYRFEVNGPNAWYVSQVVSDVETCKALEKTFITAEQNVALCGANDGDLFAFWPVWSPL